MGRSLSYITVSNCGDWTHHFVRFSLRAGHEFLKESFDHQFFVACSLGLVGMDASIGEVGQSYR